MNIKNLQNNWNELGKKDPFWAAITFEDKRGNKWNHNEFFKKGEIEINTLMDYLKSTNKPVKFNRALDFGCGVGRLTQALCKYFNEIYGVDIAPSMIIHAKKFNKFKKKCTYVLNEEVNLNIFNDNYFDVIYTNITLQHMKPKFFKKYLIEFLRIISPTGLVIFQLPSKPAKIKNKIKQTINMIIPKFIFKKFTNKNNNQNIEMYSMRKDKLIKFLNKNGGEVIDFKKNNYAGDNWISYQYIVKKK